MKIKSAQQLVAEASSRIETVPLDEATAYVDAAAYVEADGVVFVDLRDIRELDRDGMIPGAFHAPRGMLEFWVDPTSPYYKDIFGSGKKFIFYCASGWRSALATRAVQEMGLAPVAHLEGGFSAWKKSGAPITAPAVKPKA